MPLPEEGDLDWDEELNGYILEVEQKAALAQTDINDHQIATDPHGDRAYASGLHSAVLGMLGAQNGIAQLGGDQRLLPSQAPPGGGRSNAYDVIKDYGALGNGADNDIAAIQAAVDACGAAGGGEVWFPNGTYAIGTAIEIKYPNVWLHLSPGATIKRIAPITAPNFLIRNFNSATEATGYAGIGNLRVTGGTFDGNAANIAQSVHAIGLSHAENVIIEDVQMINMADGAGVLLAGCKDVVVRESRFLGLRVVSSGGDNMPAVRIETVASTTTPANMGTPGSYDNTPCVNITITRNVVKASSSYGSFGSIAGTLGAVANIYQSQIVVGQNRGENTHRYGVQAFGWAYPQIRDNTFVSCNGMVNVQVPTSCTSVMNSPVVRGNVGTNIGTPNGSTVGVVAHAITIQGWYTPAASSPPNTAIRSAIVDGNQINVYANSVGIYLLAAHESNVSGNVVNDPSSTAAGSISVIQSYRSTVTGNKMFNLRGAGIATSAVSTTYPGTGSLGANIVNNVCYGNPSYPGVNVNFSMQSTIIGNQLTGRQGNTALQCANGSTSNIIVGNVTDGEILVTGSSTANTQIANNIGTIPI